jgi:hypothetical protein
MKQFLQAVLALILLAGLLMPAGTAQALETTHVVTPLSTDWGFVDDNGAGNGVTGFESGPDTPPLGDGSFYIELNSSTAGYIMGTQKYQGTLLSDITTLSYSTYTNLSPAAMSFQINYDPDLTSATNPKPWYGRLTYEPYQNGTVTNNTWQTWDMLDGGAGEWWASPNGNSTVDDACPQAAPCTLTDLLAAFPNIGIRDDADSAIVFKAGSNWDGFAGNVDNFRIEIGGDTDIYDFEPLTTVYVDDDWVGTTPGNDPDGAGPATSFGADSFAVIQEGIDAVADNGTVYVRAGTYVEELLIDKPLSLLGPNDAINPNTGAREAEAVIHPASTGVDPYNTCTVMAYLSVSDITIKGFTFDGDNPSLSGGAMIGAADVDACEILAGYEGMGGIVVENNILSHSTYTAIDFYNYTDNSATSDNYIRYNLFENLGETTYNWGVGILVYNNFYADITDNVFDNVRTGIQTGNFHRANVGPTGSISNNTINAWRLGIFHNLWYSDASTIPVANNTINAIDSSGASSWYGMLISSWQSSANTTITDNVITIGTITQNPAAGYAVWNTPTSADLTISGGTVTGGTYGIWVNNYEGYNSNAGNTSIIIDGVEIRDADTAGVYVLDSPNNTNGATVFASIQNSLITNSVTGILAEGSDATAIANFNDIFNNTAAGITNISGNVMDAENNWWGSSEGPEDILGTVEMPFDPEPAVADMLNAEPAGLLGNSVSDDVDYHPWTTDSFFDHTQTTTFTSTGVEDGWILESSETSGKGGTLNKGATTLRIGDDAANRQYRAILSFDTSSLPEDAVITSVTLTFKYAGKSGTLPFNTHGKLLADIRMGAFKNNPALQLGDFKAGASRKNALAFTKVMVDNWYSQSLDPADFQFINLDGLTQFRLRFKKGDNNDFGADFLKIYSGNAGAANHPQLIIEYESAAP